MKIKKYTSLLILFSFFLAAGLSSCSNSKQYSKVHSKSDMGNVKDKNKHVWGK